MAIQLTNVSAGPVGLMNSAGQGVVVQNGQTALVTAIPTELQSLVNSGAIRSLDQSAKQGVPLTELRTTAAMKDTLADAPSGATLGLGDAAGSLLTGSQTNNTTANQSASFVYNIPNNYVPGANLTVTVRAKVSAARQVSATVDVVAKAVGDTGVGSDICATAAQNLTTSYADYAFVITGTGLVPGQQLVIDVFLATNDTGGSTNGTPTATAISVSAPRTA